MEIDYPASDPSADRRRYEMNMLLLFRLSVARRYHKQIQGEMNDETKESLRRLLFFIHTIPDLRRVYKEYRRERHGVFLTDLAVYWRELPNNEEMMMYKDIWEHVAQRPLAWEAPEPVKVPPRNAWHGRHAEIRKRSFHNFLPKQNKTLKARSLFLTPSSVPLLRSASPSNPRLRTPKQPCCDNVLETGAFGATCVLTSCLTAHAIRPKFQNVATVARDIVGSSTSPLFGFLLGTTLASAGTYYYILDEYRVSNELLTEDIYALQAAVHNVHNYVSSLEEKMDANQKKK
ncbi:MAG: hypothetical protein L6R36_002544 [Xanthoria steineri]|nr:MAG: hypothetical protein L6R36_002544 [Xanthoria steineri]